MIRRRGEKDHLKQSCINLELVGPVPPLRGFVVRVNRFPPLPRWAMVFRPWRGFPTIQSELRRDCAVIR
jgi:hypothetical protein